MDRSAFLRVIQLFHCCVTLTQNIHYYSYSATAKIDFEFYSSKRKHLWDNLIGPPSYLHGMVITALKHFNNAMYWYLVALRINAKFELTNSSQWTPTIASSSYIQPLQGFLFLKRRVKMMAQLKGNSTSNVNQTMDFLCDKIRCVTFYTIKSNSLNSNLQFSYQSYRLNPYFTNKN